jgi:hypothetical protein
LSGAAVALAGCSATAAVAPRSDRLLPAHWLASRHIPAVVDLAGPRRDGRLTLALAGRLSLLGSNGLAGFARGRDGYATARKTEPYIALAPQSPSRASGCSFARDDVYALEPGRSPAIIRVDVAGRAARFAALPKGSFPDGITFDMTGAFGRRLLVSATVGGATSILAVDCRGVVQTLTRRAPHVEGGIVVAPASFGIFAGQLIAPDENSGTIYAVDARGVVATVADSRLPHGGDIGVESTGFVPAGLSRQSAYLADRSVPGNAHPGTDSVLRLAGAELARAGVRPGDLLVATEGGAETLAVRCGQSCLVRHIAAGPAVTHAEGHIVFAALDPR